MARSTWSTKDIPDLTGKIIVVTGANSGIGFYASQEFAAKGAHVVMACRNPQKAQAAYDELKAAVPTASLDVMIVDLASLASVRAFADSFLAKFDQLDILVNNAGIMMTPYGVTEDGFERQMGTNHLGHFALTGLLLEVIKATPNARVVNISSMAHRMGSMDFENLLYEGGTGYNPQWAYGRSKLANLLFTYELQKRFEKAGIDALALAAHPGGSDTNLGNHLGEDLMMRLLMPIVERFMQSAADGALPTMRAAVDPQAAPADYYGPDGFMEMAGPPKKVKSNAASHNVVHQQQLWEMSEKLTGVSYL